MAKFDTLISGIAAGLLSPVAGFWIYYFIQFRHIAVSEYVDFIIRVNLLAPVISISLAANLGMFMFFIWKKMDLASRGVLLATFVYAAIVLGLKFL
jgi:hypothetical protein